MNMNMNKDLSDNIYKWTLKNNYDRNLTEQKLNIKIESILDKWWLPENLIESLKWLTNTDLNILLTKFYAEKAKNVSVNSIFSQFNANKVCHANKEKIKETWLIENEINSVLPQYCELINISPFIPFWLVSFLTKNNQKKILTISRGYDVSSDGSISLAMESANRIKNKKKEYKNIFLSTHYECPRGQFFSDKEDPPHYRIFFSSIAGRVDWNYGFERKALQDIFSLYLNLLKNLIDSGNVDIKNIEITISDMRIINKLFKLNNDKLSKYEIEEKIWIFRNDQISSNCSDDLLTYLNIELPNKYTDIDNIDIWFVEKYGLQENITYLKQIHGILHWITQEFKKLDINLKIDISRTKWVGCYDTWAFRIAAENISWKKMEIADIWFNDRTQKLLSDKKERLLVWWLWTDRIAQNFWK